jgi:NTE family protein
VRASGALPPGFPPVVIDGQHYWDGGIVCNSPMLYVLDDLPRMCALVVQVDIFMAPGDLPEDIDEVLSREKDIRLASKTLFNIAHIRDLLESRGALKELLASLPASMKDHPAVRKLRPLCDIGEMTIARLVNQGLSHAGHTKGYDFSRATVNELWATGLDDVRRSAASIKCMQPKELGPGIRVYDLPYGVTSAQKRELDTESEREQPEVSRSRRPRASRSRRRQLEHVPHGERSRRRHAA